MRFHRQHPVGPYIVDFACPARKLAIELDGGHHAEQQATDAGRTANLRRRGYRVVRFWNNDVIDKLAGVLESIRQIIVDNPSPPFRAEREGPIAERWEGEVGIGQRSGIPHLTPTLSAPGSGEGAIFGRDACKRIT